VNDQNLEIEFEMYRMPKSLTLTSVN